MSNIWGAEQTQYFSQLNFDHVLAAAEQVGLKPTGRVLTMGSMENRVYEVETEDKSVIMKFYRPGRWSQEQIQEEHDFLLDLQEYEIPVIAPLVFEGKSLFICDGNLFFATFPKQGGRAADEWTAPLIEQMGRLLARIHNIGRVKKIKYRRTLDVETFGLNNLEYLAKSPYLLPEYRNNYLDMAKLALERMKPILKTISNQRIHGDCHHGNILLGPTGPYLIDFDDMVSGPCVQDIWLAIPGRDPESLELREQLLASYETMSSFNRRELYAIESLRTLRIINFSTWIAHRFEDGAFQRTFEHFGTSLYWEKEIQAIREQLSFIQTDLDRIKYL